MTMNMKYLSACLAALILSLSAYAETESASLPVIVESFPLSDVRLTGGQFKHAEDMDIRYLLALDPDRLLAPYRKGAGLEPKAENYTNWENTGLDGHIGGHYLSALSYMFAATGNREIGARLDYVLSEMKLCQDASGDGYLAGIPDGKQMWEEIRRGDIRASSFGLNDRWVPLYNIHKTYAGLRDAYIQAGREDAKEMFLKLTDWMYETVKSLSDAQIQEMLRSEQGGLNEVFADAAAISGDPRHLELAHRFSQQSLLEPLLKAEDRLTGMHANTQIPKVIGYKRIADIEGNGEWSDAAAFFWETVVNHRSISIGGNSVSEHFHPADDFGSMLTSEQGPETCNTYNMLRLTKMLYATSGDASYMDFYERALYNHILSTIDPVQGGFVYFTSMRPGHYKVYSQPQTSFWCCVGSGLENHARYGEMIYGHESDRTLYVNLFIPSTLKWEDVELEQKTDFPDDNSVTLRIDPERRKLFTVKFRVPEWTNAEEVKLSINGNNVFRPEISDGYLSITANWRKGDEIKVEFPMSLRVMQLPDSSANWSFLYGPVVLASRMGSERLDGLFADDSRGGHIAAGPKLPLNDMPVIVGEQESLLSHLSKVDGELKFKLSGVYPSKFEGMILEPFSRVHESRYMVYWPLLSGDELEARLAEIERSEQEARRLDGMSVDKVVCGEQQPESDHFVKMEQNNTGDDEGVHWREARGWFSYELRNPELQARSVMLKLRGGNMRGADVSVNGVIIGSLGEELGNVQGSVVLSLPEELLSSPVLELRISRSEQARLTPRIYEVRLLK